MGNYTDYRLYLPDYCNGNLYSLSRQIYHYYLAEDAFITGLVRESIPGVTLKSLNPIGGEKVWDEFLTYCPLFAFLRYAFNPLVIGSGSAGESIQYNNNPYFFFCISI